MTVFVAVVTTTKVQEARFENHRFRNLRFISGDCPTCICRGPAGLRHGVSVLDVLCDAVFVGGFLDVLSNGFAICDGLVINPRLESVA